MILTNRETELTNYLYSARTIREAASEMNISSHTAKSMCKTIYKKLGIHSRTELMAERICDLEKHTEAILTEKMELWGRIQIAKSALDERK